MKYYYTEQTAKATQDLIDAIYEENIEKAKQALINSGNVNCRIHLPTNKIATPSQLASTLINEAIPYTGQAGNSSKKTAVYDLPMADTTTLLNILATRGNKPINLELTKLLLDNGAELGAIDYASYWNSWKKLPQNYFQNTPLLNAIACQNLEFAEIYMEYLEQLQDKEQCKELLNYKDKFIAGYHTALEFAIRRGYSKLATRIIRAGANVNPQPFIYCYGGGSPLHMACMLLGNSKNKEGWDPKLGSDLDLVTTLIEYGADFTKPVSTEVYDVLPQFGVLKTPSKVMLTPFDHINVAQNHRDAELRIIDYKAACDSPAFHPKKVGQIKHPFHEEECFLSIQAAENRSKQYRTDYLKSKQFINKDRLVIQSVLLKKIIENYQNTFGVDSELQQLNVTKENIEFIVEILCQHDDAEWFFSQLQLSGIFYTANKIVPKIEPLLEDKNPIFNRSLQSKLLSCPSNYYEPAEEEKPALIPNPGPTDESKVVIPKNESNENPIYKNQFFSHPRKNKESPCCNWNKPSMGIVIVALCIPLIGWAYLIYVFFNAIYKQEVNQSKTSTNNASTQPMNRL